MPSSNPAIASSVKHCEKCGAILKLRTTRDIERKRFCSARCRAQTLLPVCTLPPVPKTCTVCGSGFMVAVKGAHSAMYCSAKCRSITNSTERQYARLNSGTTPERYFKQLLGRKNRRGLSIQDLMDLWDAQSGRCALTGVQMTYRRELGSRSRTNASIDRIVPGGDYVRSNVRLVCAIVNKMRLDMGDDELQHWCWLIVEKE